MTTSTTSSTIAAAGFVGDLTGNITGDITGDVTGTLNGASIVKVSDTFTFDEFTDNTDATGTFATAISIPIGAFVLACSCTALTGFAGNVSATVLIGDGSDDDRYMTGTPDVFTTAANGIALGVPSGVQYHDAAETVTVIVTASADFTAVSAGAMTLEVFYLT
jgi:hypothetical protein